MAYDNLFFESDRGQIVPFINVKYITISYIYLIGGEGYTVLFESQIPKEQVEAYKKWLNLSTPLMVTK